MTYEEKFELLLTDPLVRREVVALKSRWGIGQKRFQNITTLIEDEKRIARVPKITSKIKRKEKEWPYFLEENGGSHS